MNTSDTPSFRPRIHLRRDEDQALHDLIERHRLIGMMGQIIMSEINLDQLFEVIVNKMNGLMNAEACSVFLYDPDNDELWSMVSSDLQRNRIRISSRCGISGWVFSHQTAQVVNAPYQDPRFFKGVDRKTGFRTRNILCIPLINRAKNCIGTLQVLNKKNGSFTQQDLGVFESASHYVTIALENATLYEELKALDKVKRKVIHHLSHELKTPLVIIQGAFRLIRKRLKNSELVKIEKSMNRGVRNLERLIDLQVKIDDILKNMKVSPETQDSYHRESLMDLIEEVEEEPDGKRLERLKEHILQFDGHSGIRKEIFDVGSMLGDICEEACTAAKKRDLCLMRQFDDDARVYTDKVAFRKVCRGLLRNAIENTPDEGCIEISVKSNSDGVVIAFCDHGMGINEDDQKQIFSGFFPTQPTEAYMSKKPYAFNAGGAGVDLLRVKTFAEKLNFNVNFVSQRCPVLLTRNNTCPGRISACQFTGKSSECIEQGGSTFEIRFLPFEEERSGVTNFYQ